MAMTLLCLLAFGRLAVRTIVAAAQVRGSASDAWPQGEARISVGPIGVLGIRLPLFPTRLHDG